MRINFKDIQEIHHERESHLWYGGAIKEFKIPELTNVSQCRLSLVGNVECILYVKDSDDILHIDTTEGLINTEIMNYIDNDYDLTDAINKKHHKYTLELYSTNSFVVEMVGYDGEVESNKNYCLEYSYNVSDGIEEIRNMKDTIISKHNTDPIAMDLRQNVMNTIKMVVDDVRGMLGYGRSLGGTVTDEEIQEEISRLVTIQTTKDMVYGL